MGIVNKESMVSLQHIDSFTIKESTRLKMKERMKELKLSVNKLSQKTEGTVSKSYLNSIVHGQKTTVKKDKFLSICKSLNVDVEEILQGVNVYK